MITRDKFYLDVAHALSGCQLVEQELKLYIAEALELANRLIDARMPFKFCGEDYEDASLERLIEAFKKLSDNQPLIMELGRFKKERNFLSHKSITTCLDWEGELSAKAVLELQTRLEGIESEATRMRAAIHAEATRHLNSLYSDRLD